MLCVASHDAGGAEVLASYVARNNVQCAFLLDGPAVKVFERRLGHAPALISLASAVRDCDHFLTGTSWQSDLEWKVIGAAKEGGKTVTTFIDHWGHYRERFIRNGVECLPDLLWVGDADAEKMASEIFPSLTVQRVANPYFDDMREAISHLEKINTEDRFSSGLRVLFVCEPLSEHGQKEFGDSLHWGYTEFDALRYFVANLGVLGQTVESLVIRPHPSEKNGKYDAIACEFGPFARVGGHKTLLQEIAESDVVAGCESMAMVVGLIAGRRVIAAIPPGGMPCSLPQQKIEFLQDLHALQSRANPDSPCHRT